MAERRLNPPLSDHRAAAWLFWFVLIHRVITCHGSLILAVPTCSNIKCLRNMEVCRNVFVIPAACVPSLDAGVFGTPHNGRVMLSDIKMPDCGDDIFGLGASFGS